MANTLLPMIDSHGPAEQPSHSKPLAADPRSGEHVDAGWLRRVCVEAGADDAGFVKIGHADIQNDRDDILHAFPRTRTLISIVVKMNREPIRSPARSIANLEFHRTGDAVNDVAHRIVTRLEAAGIRAMHPAMGFPMEMDRFPGKIWVVSHKTVAVAAGLGSMGLHRNVIHPTFGNFILLGTVLMDREVTAHDTPLTFDPCVSCKLCVAACPVGAIGSDGHFNFLSCYTHNYREFMGGFTNWVEHVAESRSAEDYRARVSDSESSSMWQSLSFGANYKAAYCMAVCPAGEDVIAPFQADRKAFTDDVLTPLKTKRETVYVVPGSDAETHVAKRFPRKSAKHVANTLRPRSIRGFFDGLPLAFQRTHATHPAIYHFTFTGHEGAKATVIIKRNAVHVVMGHQGIADVRIIADSSTWLDVINHERNAVWAVVRRKIWLGGPLRLLRQFQRCFPA